MLSRLPTSLSFCHWLEPVGVAEGGLKTLKTRLSRQVASDLWKPLGLQGHSIHSLRCMEGYSKDALGKSSLRGRGTWPPGSAESSEQPSWETFLRFKPQWKLRREDRWMCVPTPLGWKALLGHQRHFGSPLSQEPSYTVPESHDETHDPEI